MSDGVDKWVNPKELPSKIFAEWTVGQVDVIKTQIAPGCTDDELMLFMYVCKRTQLDPFARQIYAIKRKRDDGDGNKKSVMIVQTSIDGFRLIASRSKEYAGQSAPEHLYTEDDAQNLILSRITVFRINPITGERYAAGVGEARMKEYRVDGKAGFMWVQKPHIMLDKCAEALALRKAFPQELSGLYTDDEIGKSAAGYEEPIIESFEEAEAKGKILEKIATLAADSDMPEKYSKRVTDSWEKIKGAPMEVLETTEKNLQNHLNNAREEKKNKEKVAKVVKDNQDK